MKVPSLKWSSRQDSPCVRVCVCAISRVCVRVCVCASRVTPDLKIQDYAILAHQEKCKFDILLPLTSFIASPLFQCWMLRFKAVERRLNLTPSPFDELNLSFQPTWLNVHSL